MQSQLQNCGRCDVAKELKEFYEALVKLVDESEKPCTYVDTFKKRFNSLEYYKDHKYRKDAVLEFEIIITFPKMITWVSTCRKRKR